MLGILLVLTPLTVALAWPPLVSAALLILTLILLLFTGQTVIFLLRLVAADRRGRRTPRSATARKTVGMLEDESARLRLPTMQLAERRTRSDVTMVVDSARIPASHPWERCSATAPVR